MSTRKILAAAVLTVSALVPMIAASPADAAVPVESNFAVAGTPPSFSANDCTFTLVGVKACFEAGGDKFWVKDTLADGESAGIYWENYVEGQFYRKGECINSLSAGTWGVCNKDFVEGSRVTGLSIRWDRSADLRYIYNGPSTDWTA